MSEHQGAPAATPECLTDAKVESASQVQLTTCVAPSLSLHAAVSVSMVTEVVGADMLV